VEELRLPRADTHLRDGVAVEAEGADQNLLPEIAQPQIAKFSPERGFQGLVTVIGVQEAVEVADPIPKRVIENLTAVPLVDLCDFGRCQPGRQAERQDSVGGRPGEQTDFLEVARIQPFQALESFTGEKPADASPIK
jgi:hypothetical protein